MKLDRRLVAAVGAVLGTAGVVAAIDGFTDTPLLPNAPYHVHDPNRPQPPVVDPGPGPVTPTKPPSDAVVLFDGTDLSKWTTDGKPPTWKLEGGVMVAQPGKGGLRTVDKFGDCQLHVEWTEPETVRGNGQERGNSGVFFLNAFEVQVLDCSGGHQTYADGTTGALYGSHPPLVNACRPPGQWNVYDILFTGPKYKDGKLVEPCYATVVLNGILVQNHADYLGPTVWRAVAKYPNNPMPEKDFIALQEHGNPVRFRNIWVRELKGYDAAVPAPK